MYPFVHLRASCPRLEDFDNEMSSGILRLAES
jgi:hypothetical protein